MDEVTSVVVTSFEQPRSLRLVLGGVLALARKPGELIVTDDGSGPGVEELVAEFRERASHPVHFLWQENLGFRKAAALNAAIRRARGDVLLFLDGDTIPQRAWLDEHLRALGRGADYATGGYVRLDVAQAEALEAGGDPDGCLRPPALRRLRRVHRRNLLYRWLRVADKPKILGGNWSVRREALWRVNGFDERYAGVGKEDSDLRNRLNAAGFRGASVWSRAFVLHCPHELDPQRLRPGDARHQRERAYYDAVKGRTRCADGIVQDAGASADQTASRAR